MVIALRKELGHFTALLTLKLVMQHLAKDRSEYEEMIEGVIAAFRERSEKHMAKRLAEMENSPITKFFGTDELAFEDALNQVCSEFRLGLAYTEDRA